MRVGAYLSSVHDDTVERLQGQVRDAVPRPRRRERFPNGNSIAWAAFHVARHADLALRVLGADRDGLDALLAPLPGAATRGGAGLQEVQQHWLDDVDDAASDAYVDGVLMATRAALATVTDADLDRTPDVGDTLRFAGVEEDEFGWLYAQWSRQPVAFFARWPLTGHITHHVGEMITIRNQMGLSPFR